MSMLEYVAPTSKYPCVHTRKHPDAGIASMRIVGKRHSAGVSDDGNHRRSSLFRHTTSTHSVPRIPTIATQRYPLS